MRLTSQVLGGRLSDEDLDGEWCWAAPGLYGPWYAAVEAHSFYQLGQLYQTKLQAPSYYADLFTEEELVLRLSEDRTEQEKEDALKAVWSLRQPKIENEAYGAVCLYDACLSVRANGAQRSQSWSSIFEDIQKQLGNTSSYRKKLKGNFSAGVRLRRKLRSLRRLCKSLRASSLQSRGAKWGLEDVVIDTRPNKPIFDFTDINQPDPRNGMSGGWKGWEQTQAEFIWSVDALNNREAWMGRYRNSKNKDNLTRLGNELHSALMAAAESGWKTIKYENRRNETAAQRFRTATLKIEKLATELLAASSYLAKLQKDPAFVANEFPLGSLVSRTSESYDWRSGLKSTQTEMGVVADVGPFRLLVLWNTDEGESWVRAWDVCLESAAKPASEKAKKVA